MDLSLLKRMNVLYVEDDDATRVAFTRLLSKFFNKIYTTDNAYSAQLLIQDKCINIVFTDIKMPKKSGIELSREIRKFNKNIPIVVMTSYPEQDDMIESVRLGLSDFLLKPVNYSDFKRMLEEILDKLIDNKMMYIEIGENYIYDYRSKMVIKDDTEIVLTDREIKVFEYFLQNEKKLITRSQIEDIASNGEWMSESAFKNFILKLRKKLPKNCIKTLKNLGYMYVFK